MSQREPPTRHATALFVINLNAKTLGLTPPQSRLPRAKQVIE
jgi:hypothetical protein